MKAYWNVKEVILSSRPEQIYDNLSWGGLIWSNSDKLCWARVWQKELKRIWQIQLKQILEILLTQSSDNKFSWTTSDGKRLQHAMCFSSTPATEVQLWHHAQANRSSWNVADSWWQDSSIIQAHRYNTNVILTLVQLMTPRSANKALNQCKATTPHAKFCKWVRKN